MRDPDDFPDWATGEGLPMWGALLLVTVIVVVVLSVAILEGAGIFG